MSSNDESAIRDLIAARTAAINVADLDAIEAPLADNAVTFDMVGALRNFGTWDTKGWLSMYADGPRWEDRDVTIDADGDVAFAHMLSHVTGRRNDDVEVDMWFRVTLGLRRLDDCWRIVHEHQSEPFDIESGKAALDLKP